MNLLVVSAHPDDETLGCGGTLLKYKQNKHKVFWLNFTDMREKYGYSQNQIKIRQREIEKVTQLYSVDGFFNLSLKPAGLDEYQNSFLIEKVSRIFKKILPNTVILPFKNDAHSDHRIAFEVAYACCKNFRSPSINKILMMEIISETDFASSDLSFIPNYLIDVSNFLEKKIAIMNTYNGELLQHPFPRSAENIKAIAITRGATAGCKYAESFMLLKSIE